MPLVRVKLKRAATTIAAPAKPHALGAKLDAVLAAALATQSELLEPLSLEIFPSAEEKASERSELDVTDLADITLGDLREQGLGFFWVAPCRQLTDGMQTPDAPVRTGRCATDDALSGMMNSRVELCLPPRSQSRLFAGRIFNALLTDLELCGLGWEKLDAGPEGSLPASLCPSSLAVHPRVSR